MSRIPKKNKEDLLLRQQKKINQSGNSQFAHGSFLYWKKATRSDKEKSRLFERYACLTDTTGVGAILESAWKSEWNFQPERKSIESSENVKTEKLFPPLYHSQKKIGKWTIFFAVRGVFIRKLRIEFYFIVRFGLKLKALAECIESWTEESLKVHKIHRKFADKKAKKKFFHYSKEAKKEKKVRRNEIKMRKRWKFSCFSVQEIGKE